MGAPLNFDDWLPLTQRYADGARAVDSGHWDLWPGFFTERCVYRLQPRENHERGFPLATLSFTSKGMLKDRVHGIKETLLHDPCCQRHIVGTPVVRSTEGGQFRCEANCAAVRPPRHRGAHRGRCGLRHRQHLHPRPGAAVRWLSGRSRDRVPAAPGQVRCSRRPTHLRPGDRAAAPLPGEG